MYLSKLTIPLIILIGFQITAPADELDEKLANVVPSGQSLGYTKIPWHTDILAAQERAKASGKRLFLWVMDGHPLGCT